MDGLILGVDGLKMICPKNPEHGAMVKNGFKVGKQRWLCMKCGASGTTKKEEKKNDVEYN